MGVGEKIMELSIGGLLTACLLPVALLLWYTNFSTDWETTQQTIYLIVPLIVVVGIAMGFITYVVSRNVGGGGTYAFTNIIELYNKIKKRLKTFKRDDIGGAVQTIIVSAVLGLVVASVMLPIAVSTLNTQFHNLTSIGGIRNNEPLPYATTVLTISQLLAFFILVGAILVFIYEIWRG